MSVLLKTQEHLCSTLTEFSVWVQNEVTNYESIERISLRTRNAARRELVRLWMSDHRWADTSSEASSIIL